MENSCEAPKFMSSDFYQSALLAARDKGHLQPLEFGSMSLLTIIAVMLNIVNHICLLLTFSGITYKCVQLRFQRTAMHAFLCTFGLLFFLSEGMMVRHYTNPVMRSFSDVIKDALHISLSLGAGLLGMGGIVHKMLAKTKHFNTSHGRFGLATYILWIVNVILGIVAYIFSEYKHSFGPLLSKLVHSFIGIICFFMSVFAQYYGYESGFFRRNFSNAPVYRGLLTITMILTILGPIEMCVDHYIHYMNSEPEK